jgi:hypothetical protein
MRQPRPLTRLWWTALAGVLMLVSQTASTHLAAAGQPTVVLTPTGPTTLPQGRPFAIRATISNTDPNPVAIVATFRLTGPAGSGAPVPFKEWGGTLPASGSVNVDLSVAPGQWFAETGQFQVDALVDGNPAATPLALTVGAPAVQVPKFQDLTAASGIVAAFPEGGCGQETAGAAWTDAEGDGDLDLYIPVRGQPAQLWVNDGVGHFVDQAVARGVTNGSGPGMSATSVDYDNDGDQDLYVVNNGTNRLYRNDGTGHYVDVASAAGVDDDHFGASASWGDYDRDGLVDLYVTNNVNCTDPEHLVYQPDVLYHQLPDHTFEDATSYLLTGGGSTLGSGFQASWFDYDNDGDQDLYLANDYIGPDRDENHLWRNDGSGPNGTWVFTDVSVASGTDYRINSMGMAVGDYDRDLDLDFAVSDIKGNNLARNQGNGTFVEVGGPANVARPFQTATRTSITWGLAFQDLNLDGWEDLFVAAGSLWGSIDQPNQLFVNDGQGSGGTFSDLTAPAHMTDPRSGRGVAFADFDRDGRMDLFVVNEYYGAATLYRNTTPRNGRHWLEVRLTGTASNRDGCGAKLTFTVAGQKMLRELFCGSTSLGTGNDLAVHVGLGSAATVSKLVIDWPSGARQVLQGIAADRLLTVVEP